MLWAVLRSPWWSFLGILACHRAEAPPAGPPESGVLVIAPVVARDGREAPVVQAEAPERVVLRHARLIDGTGAPPREDVDLLVEGGRIAQVGEDLVPAQPAREIDLGGRTLVPGFIDAHVHLGFSPADSYEASVEDEVSMSEADRALEGARNARVTLLAGFTTVRNVGGSLADRALRDAIADGHVPGPRMLVANHSIGITGGHCDGTNAMLADVFPERQDHRHGVADGPEEVRRAVRWQIKHGADVIKICATGGVMSQGDAVGAAQMTAEEIAAAVAEANRADRKVAAHAHGNEGIRAAILGGVHSIEHGSILDEPTLALMKKRGTFLVPTTYVARAVEEKADAGKISISSAAKAREIAPKMRDSFRLALRSGVKIALGSDAGVFAHGENAKEFSTMVSLGMKPMDAIVAGTSRAAELLGLSDVGRVTQGARADLVVVDGDPLADITVLERPAMVMKGGALHLPPQWSP
jgi:imidazolonepropionase-like amidohydrolase